MANRHDRPKIRCGHCKGVFTGIWPKGGDRSSAYPYRHKLGADFCPGSFVDVVLFAPAIEKAATPADDGS